MALGDTIRAQGHVYVLCSDPEPDGSVVGFNFTEKDFDTDHTCIVQPNDFKAYLRKESVIAYRWGDLFSTKRIEGLRLLEPLNHGPVSADLLLRIQQGALKSPATPPI